MACCTSLFIAPVPSLHCQPFISKDPPLLSPVWSARSSAAPGNRQHVASSCRPAAVLRQAKAIQRLIVQLCSELRGVALPLVSAFGVPDHILRAPIGLGVHSGVDIYKEYLAAVGFDV